MLVLTRKLNQSITIGNDVKITVLGLEGDRVSLGVDAPRDVRIFRSELLEATGSVNRDSVVSSFPGAFAWRKKENE